LLEELGALDVTARKRRMQEIVQGWLADGTFALMEVLAQESRKTVWDRWVGYGHEPEFNRGKIVALNEWLNTVLGLASNEYDRMRREEQPEDNLMVYDDLERAEYHLG
jgi:hypothetical protein